MQKINKYDFLIVGSGLYGSTFARVATDNGFSCLVVEKRDVPGGNIRCENIEGINVHKYGAHIFHTSDRSVWDFVTGLVDMNRYTNCPVANAGDGKLYNLPFNMNTFYQMWGVKTPQQAQQKIEKQKSEALAAMRQAGISEPQNLEQQALLLVGKDIYFKLIKDYTEKQWGRACTELPASIIRRLPVRLVFDNNYFNDSYQGVPEGGYNKLIDVLLAGIEVRTSVDYLAPENRKALDALADTIIYTGPIDAYFDFRFGPLQWRTVRFETEIIDTCNFQGNAVVNYTSHNEPFTRIIEHKHFESFGQAVYDNPKTVISREYSSEWHPGIEPYYPISDEQNLRLLVQYQRLASEQQNVCFGGRLAEYKYYDMAPTIKAAIDQFHIIKDKK